MDYYITSKPSENKIPENNLQELGKRLKIFVNTYVKHIYIKDPKHLQILREIDHIADLILTKQYSQLFDCPLQTIEFESEENKQYFIDEDNLPF